MQLVAVLCLLALFTHNHVFWITALLLAMVHLPDFTTPINSIAQSLEEMAGDLTTAPDVPAADEPATPASETLTLIPATAMSAAIEPHRLPLLAAVDIDESKQARASGL
jgi:hypothetical protein